MDTSNQTAGHGVITPLPDTQEPETLVNEYERWQARFSELGYAFGKEPNYF